MSQINSDYLLRKISDRNQFDFETTKQTIIDYYGDEITDKQWKWLDEVEYYNEQDFINQLENCTYFDEFCDIWECVQHDYPTMAKVFARVFTEIVQPKIKEYIKNQRDGSEETK